MRTPGGGTRRSAGRARGSRGRARRARGSGALRARQEDRGRAEEGDLSENAEYHALKDEQAHLETKIARLRGRRQTAVVVEPETRAGIVAFGGTVRSQISTAGREQTFTIVGPTEPDLKSGRLSAESPVARALLGAAPGDEVDRRDAARNAPLARRLARPVTRAAPPAGSQ